MSTSEENETKVKKQKYFIDVWLQDEAFSNWFGKIKQQHESKMFCLS